jgi:hypothetical protein
VILPRSFSPDAAGGSVFQVFAAGGAAGIACQEAEHEDPEEKKDDRVYGDLEGEHGDRPASGTESSSYGARIGKPDADPAPGAAIGVD